MMGIAIAGISPLVLGAIVGRVGRKLGTAIAGVLVLAWFGVLGWFGLTGKLDGPVVQDLALYLLIGVVAFLIGSNLTSRFSPVTK
ncbi:MULTISPECIES: hypothetical protein [unclassified Microbacterium]|uniref:hypothetical protein n=1 Tax=unclassified Microbacterium TaxID=2609290 RepID=UPI00364D6B24